MGSHENPKMVQRITLEEYLEIRKAVIEDLQRVYGSEFFERVAGQIGSFQK